MALDGRPLKQAHPGPAEIRPVIAIADYGDSSCGRDAVFSQSRALHYPVIHRVEVSIKEQLFVPASYLKGMRDQRLHRQAVG